MIYNNGFLIKNDRFSLLVPERYELRGHLSPRAELSAEVGGREIPLEIRMLTENVDERYGGAEAVAAVRIPDDFSPAATLRFFVKKDGRKRLCFAIRGNALLEKRHPVKLFIDERTVNEKDGFFRLQGWAAGKEAVSVRVYDKDGKEMAGAAERYKRLDVAKLFEECPVDPNSGFHIELRPIPKKEVKVVFSSGEASREIICRTDALSAKTEKAARLWKKGRDYLKYNGVKPMIRKTYDKLFNPAMKEVVYADWIRKHLPSESLLEKQRKTLFQNGPLFSIVVPLYQTPEAFLGELAASVRRQTYADWELILSDGSGDESLKEVLAGLEASDGRIKVLRHESRLRIAENTNAAIGAAKGDVIVFADHDDLLTPNALFELATALCEHPETELLYSDEDKIGIGEKYMQPNLKPDFNPDLLRSVNYICHLVAVRKSLIDRVGLLDPAYDGAQDHDFLLRCTEATEAILHIPKILYHWRFFEGSTAANPESKMYAFEAGQRAVQAHIDRKGWPAKVEQGEFPGIYRTVWQWKETPKVSILIPNKDHIEDLDQCLKSIDRGRVYPNLEIVIVENNSTEAATFEYYEALKERDPRVILTSYEGPFNYSAINNAGAKVTSGDYLFLLNNDTAFISEDVIGELLGFCMRGDVGAVGARLYYGDDTIQHAGVIVGWGGIAGHAFVNQGRGETGYQHRVICQQDYSAVTAACMMVKKEVFDKVGGFTEELAVAFNDIDLCMKIRKAGYLIVYNPYAELYHYESKSRGLDQGDPEKVKRFQGEIETFRKRWPEILRDGDPYYNPNLSMVTQDFSLKHN